MDYPVIRHFCCISMGNIGNFGKMLFLWWLLVQQQHAAKFPGLSRAGMLLWASHPSSQPHLTLGCEGGLEWEPQMLGSLFCPVADHGSWQKQQCDPAVPAAWSSLQGDHFCHPLHGREWEHLHHGTDRYRHQLEWAPTCHQMEYSPPSSLQATSARTRTASLALGSAWGQGFAQQ